MPAVIPIAIMAGSSIASAAITAHAANKASQQQTNAENNALGVQRDVFSQQQAALNPFINLGTSAMGRYNQHYGGGMPTGAGMSGNGGYGMSLGSGLQAPGAPQSPMPRPAGLVRVQAPTGEVALLPQMAAQMAVQRGARVLDQGGMNMPPQHLSLGY